MILLVVQIEVFIQTDTKYLENYNNKLNNFKVWVYLKDLFINKIKTCRNFTKTTEITIIKKVVNCKCSNQMKMQILFKTMILMQETLEVCVINYF